MMYIFCIYKKYTSAAAYMIRVTYTFCIVCIYCVCTKSKHIQRFFQLDSCIRIGFFKKHTFQVSSRFYLKSELCTSFVQLLRFLYICRNLMYMFWTFIILRNFDLYNLYKIYTILVLCIICIIFFDKGVPKCHGFH